MFVKGLYELIVNDPGVSALVGNKVFYILAPKGAVLPYIVLSCVTTGETYTMSGMAGLRDGLWQVDAYATDYYSSQAISLAVRDLLGNFRGNLPDADATAVAAVFLEKSWDMNFEEGAKGFVYRALLEFRIWHYDTALPVSTPLGGPAVIDGGTATNDDTV